MYFLEGIFRFLSGLGRTLIGPFKTIAFKLRTLKTGNPVSRALYALRQSAKQLSYYVRAPFGYAGRTFARFLALFGIQTEYLDNLAKKPSPAAEAQKPKKRGVQKTRKLPAQNNQFSQIHLIHDDSRKRTIVHVGGEVGQSATDVTLEHGKHKPVNLRFSQVNPLQYQSHILLSRLGGEVPLWVDGEAIKHRAPLFHQSTIRLGHDMYSCELKAWSATSLTTQVDAGWETSAGPVRSQNEDAIGIYQHPDAYLFTIADGVGGGEAGERISEFAVQYMLAVFHKNIHITSLKWRDIFQQAYNNINAEVRNFAKRYAFITGSTLTSVVIKDWDAHIAHVGDSRLYHWHANKLRQITTDHVDEVETTPYSHQTGKSEPLSYQKRDILSKAIGKTDRIEPDFLTIRLQPGDKLLLCTDGVTDEVSDKELARLLKTMRVEQLAPHLVQLAGDREGKDNATVIALDVLSHTYATDNWVTESSSRVFVDYDKSWSFRLKRPQQMHTSPSFVSRITGRVILASLVVLLAAISTFALLQQEDTPPEDPPIAVISPTPTNTPMYTPTVSPTTPATATPLPTPVPTQPPVTPTSTLRPSTHNLIEPIISQLLARDFSITIRKAADGELA